MDWVQFLVTVIAAMIGAATPVAAGFWWLGGLGATVKSMQETCSRECERQQREHSRLFDRTDRHTEQITEIRGDVDAIDGRVTAMEKVR